MPRNKVKHTHIEIIIIEKCSYLFVIGSIVDCFNYTVNRCQIATYNILDTLCNILYIIIINVNAYSIRHINGIIEFIGMNISEICIVTERKFIPYLYNGKIH